MSNPKGRQSALKGQLTTMKKLLDEHDTTPLTATKYRYITEKLVSYTAKMDEINEEIYCAADDAGQAAQQIEYDGITETILELTSRLGLIPDPAGPAVPVASAASTGGDQWVNLPKFELPNFSGELCEWPSFADLFLASVHGNAKLKNSQKLQYLKTSLKGEALTLIQAIPVTDANYDEAWTLLKSRYDHKREIINAILRRFFRQPKVQSVSATTLRSLHDTSNECVKALKVMSRPVDTWDDMLVYCVTERLDSESRRQWILSLTNDDPPKFEDLMKFIDQRARALVETEDDKPSQPVGTKRMKDVASHSAITQGTCPACGGSHVLQQCTEFVNSSVTQRRAMIRRLRVCYVCLRLGHMSSDCSRKTCNKCKGKHHSMVHEDRAAVSTGTGTSEVASYAANCEVQKQVLLATALVSVKDVHGRPHTLRALLDDGSQGSFATEACVQRLGLETQKVRVAVSGVSGAGVGVASKKTSLHVTSLTDGTFTTNIDCLVIPKVTRRLPNEKCRPDLWGHLRNLKLADPSFCEPGHIDLLFGADVKADVLLPTIRRGKVDAPIAQETRLGWIISGRLETPCQEVVVGHVNCELDTTMKRFWELEELPDIVHLTAEEKSCEEHFADTHGRDSTGRYIVRFPFRSPRPPLGSSRERAMRRLLQVEKRFKENPGLHEQYKAFMKEYLDLGHMVCVPDSKLDRPVGATFYLPHHPVLKESSSTTKLRVVFDGSAQSSSGVSLNKALMVGPKLQDDLFQILVRFRFHLIAFSADVCKMFRQILIHPDERDYQRILWRNHPSEPVQDFLLTTVTYGTAAAPYQASRSVKQLALDEEHAFPLASAAWRKDSYVDDLLSGAESVDAALELQDQLIRMMGSGQLLLRKWSSNHPALLEALPVDMRETTLPLSLDVDETVKTLGLIWHPASDIFSFRVVLPPTQPVISKRIVLSEMSKVFDPVGWLSPTTVKAKILFQQLWRSNLGWDEKLPCDVMEKWLAYRAELPVIQSISIPRCVMPIAHEDVELHGFCDASEQAYASALYLRVRTGDTVLVSLLTAKTKVSPLKQISLPRLELCGALLLARLISTVKKTLTVSIDGVHCWSDSTVVLHWLAKESARLKTFEANRVSEIQDVVSSGHWHHVRSEENPADCASRGISPSELSGHPLWWTGPAWLALPVVPIPSLPDLSQTELDEVRAGEKKAELSCLVSVTMDNSLMTKYSSLMKLQRVTAYCRRFIDNARVKKGGRDLGPLTVRELDRALNFWISRTQEEEFGPELECIRANRNLPVRSRIAPLNPFLDESGVMRVGGRIQLARVPEDQRHPAVLPRKHPLTTLIIGYEHLRLLHAGPQLLQGALQRRFWILCARDAVRQCTRKCVICVRHRGEVCQQMMGNLPAARLAVDRPFLSTGVDYAGPFQLRVVKGRGHKQFKAYICLFICLTTRAIHLEAVSDMTSQAFIAALQRFVSRRGKCRELYSDCGTNFVGANRELKEALAAFRKQDLNGSIARYAAAEGIDWKFNPPAAPHQGGLWEAGVKSVKYHLRRIIGSSVLNWEEFNTALCQIEACLNSRPLCPLTVDPSDLAALTPGHFLVGGPLTAIPEPDLTSIKLGRLARWQLVQQVVQHFWKRWASEYLARLQQRPKWWTYHPNLTIGDMVLVKDERFAPLHWPLGRIVDVHPGLDGKVRKVTIRTKDGNIQRPIVKVCHLPIDTQVETRTTGNKTSALATDSGKPVIVPKPGVLV